MTAGPKRTIRKKALSEYFEKVLSGQKTYEFRLADFDCEPGDTLILEEVDEKSKKPTGRSVRKVVGHVGKTKGPELYPKEQVERYGYQIISLIEPDNG